MNAPFPLVLLTYLALAMVDIKTVIAQSQENSFGSANTSSVTESRFKKMDMHSLWQFRKLGDSAWLPAVVPGMVHLDLLRNNIIPDPFYGTNEERLQWIESVDWEYRTQVVCDSELLNHSKLELVFEGLDTFASVYVNDSLVLCADNMFRIWRVDCKSVLKNGHNTIRIVFTSAVRRGREMSKHLPLTLPGDEKVFVRKAQYQFGWDWGPRFVSCGVWRSVRLEAWNDIRLESVAIRQESLSVQAAHLQAMFELNVLTEGVYILRVQGTNGYSQSPVSIRQEKLVPGKQLVRVDWIVPKPELWWSNGLGKPHLYKYICDVFLEGSPHETLDSKRVSVGLRTITIVQRPDSSGVGFAIELNGQPVFMKGANYIPPDSFLPRVRRDTYQRIVRDVARANMNMLRVWGGGAYENDDFYTLCDEHGILIWQDFMFACAMYPGDSAFVENVRAEAEDNVKRLRNHPCIALWCGNNENDEGWHNWGWQKQYKYSSNDSATVWHWYETLFHNVLPAVVAQRDQGRFYWSSSPQYGWGRKESLLRGDAHYWGVWWGLEPFSTYEKKVGRFMSEYGMQSLPAVETLASIAPPQEQYLTSATMKVHQKHPTGYDNIQQYLQRDYKQPKNFEQYVYVTQLLQAKGISMAIEAHRRAKPYCMGTLYWQLNDCWHVASWSSVDYLGRWKALHYAVQELYNSLLLSIHRVDGALAVYLVSDIVHDTCETLEIRLCSFDGHVLWAKTQAVTAKANESTLCAKIYDSELPTFNKSASVLVVRFKNSLGILAEKLYYFVPPKDLSLRQPTIDYTVSSSSEGQYITIRSNILSKNVFIRLREDTSKRLSTDSTEVRFSTNFFDILPGETKIVRIEADKPLANVQERIVVQSLIDSY